MEYYLWDMEEHFYILIKYYRGYLKIAIQQFNLKEKEKNKDSLDNQEGYSGVWCAIFLPCQVNNMSLRQK